MTNLCLSNSRASLLFCTPSQYKTLHQQNLLLPSLGLCLTSAKPPSYHTVWAETGKGSGDHTHACHTYTRSFFSYTQLAIPLNMNT